MDSMSTSQVYIGGFTCNGLRLWRAWTAALCIHSLVDTTRLPIASPLLLVLDRDVFASYPRGVQQGRGTISSTHLLEHIPNSIRDLLGGSLALSMSGAVEDLVDTLIYRQISG